MPAKDRKMLPERAEVPQKMWIVLHRIGAIFHANAGG
jgi:hypothetical protein